jgi:subtilisin family serine protease
MSRLLLPVAVVFYALFSCAHTAYPVHPLTGPPYRLDRILIKANAQSSEVTLRALHNRFSCKELQTFERFPGIQVLSIPEGATVADCISRYEQSGSVEFAEPDYIRHIDATPNDPKYLDGTLWALNNSGQNGGTPHADIDAPEAWSVLTSASNIVVAILDTGIRYTHEDLASNVWTNPTDGSHGTNAVAGTSDPSDDNGHGTLMAGVLGAVGNNAKGVVGVAWQVQMMACKCFDSSGNASDSAILACIDYALGNGARIISASFDSTGFGNALSNAIFSASAAGIIFVASAGNNSTNVDVIPHYPACYRIDNILSVAYTTRNDTLGDFSNYGATNVDLAAPGDQIYSTYPASDSSYYPPAGLGINLAGTSFGAAYVSGACALMLAKYPAENYQSIIHRLLEAVDPLPGLAGKCLTGGRLNLYKALSPPIHLSPLPFTGAGFGLSVSAGPNRVCVIQASADQASWTPIWTNTTSAMGTFDFYDGQSMELPRRFYRAVSSP